MMSMWSLEHHQRERDLVSVNRPTVLRAYSSSPPRTPKVPVHTRGFIVNDTSGAWESQNCYFFPPVTSAADDATDSTSVHDKHYTLPAGNNIEKSLPNVSAVDSDALELWATIEAKYRSNNKSNNADITRHDSERRSDSASQHAVSRASSHSDEPFNSDSLLAKLSSPPTAVDSSPLVELADPSKSMYRNARNTNLHFLSQLPKSPKVDIVKETTDEVYVRGVSLPMLEYFCGIDTMTSLLFASHKSNQISIPSSHASRNGIIRVIRYMRRWCANPSSRPTCELHTPPSIKEGISTLLACRFFGLDADAKRIEKVVLEEFMGSPRFFITDEDVELIWCHYEGKLRYTPFGDSIVWCVLEDVMGGERALADEVRWMLEQEEYGDLKARVREEMKRKEWRNLGRKGFLRRCQVVRELAVGIERVGDENSVQKTTSTGARGSCINDRPLPSLPMDF